MPIVNNFTSGSRVGHSQQRYKDPSKSSDVFKSFMQVKKPEIQDRLTNSYVVSTHEQVVASEDDEIIFGKLNVNKYSSITPSQEVSSEGSAELYYTIDGQKPDVSEALEAKEQSNIRFGTHIGNPMVQIYYGAVKYLPAYAIPSKWEVRRKCNESSLGCSPRNRINTYTNSSDSSGLEMQHMVNNGIAKQNFSDVIRIHKDINGVGDQQRRRGKELLKSNVCSKEKVDISETKECRSKAAEKSKNRKLLMDDKLYVERYKRIITDAKETDRNGVHRTSSNSIRSRVTQDEIHNESDTTNLPSKDVRKSEEGEEEINCTAKKETKKSKKNMEAGINSISKSSDQKTKATKDKVEHKMVNGEKTDCTKKTKVKTSKKNKDRGESAECKLLGEFSQVTDVNNTNDKPDNSLTNEQKLEVKNNSLCSNLFSVTEEIFSHKKKKVKPSTSKKKIEKVKNDKLSENALKDINCTEVVRPAEGKEVSTRNSELEKDTRTVNNVTFKETASFNNDVKDNHSNTDNSHTSSAIMDNLQKAIEDVVDNFQPEGPTFSDKMKNVMESIEAVVAESKTYRKQSAEWSQMHTTSREKGDKSTKTKQVKDITDNVTTEDKSAELVGIETNENEKEEELQTEEENPRTILSYLPNLAKELDRRVSDRPQLEVTGTKTLLRSSVGGEPRKSNLDSGIFTMSEDVSLNYSPLLHEVGHASIVPKRKSYIDFADMIIKKLKIDTENSSLSSSDSGETSDRDISDSQNHLHISLLSGNSPAGCKSPIWNSAERNGVSTASPDDKTSETSANNINHASQKTACYREVQEADLPIYLVPPTASASTLSLNEPSPWERFFSDDILDLEDFDQSSFLQFYPTKFRIQKTKKTDKSVRNNVTCKNERNGNWLQRPKGNIKV